MIDLFSDASVLDRESIDNQLERVAESMYPALVDDGYSVKTASTEYSPTNIYDDLQQVLPHYYEDVEHSLFDSFSIAEKLEPDAYGYFTIRKMVFIVRYDGEDLAMTVATLKRGGSVKFGPTATLRTNRKRGLAWFLRDVVEQFFRNIEGIRKFYLTVSNNNHPALLFNLHRGFRIEGILHNQYKKGSNELVMGRFASDDLPGHKKTHKTEAEVFSAAAPVAGIWLRPDITELQSFLEPDLSSLYGKQDRLFYEHLANACEVKKNDYSRKGKTIIQAREQGHLTGLAICSPKRGGSLKIAPIICEDQQSFNALFQEVMRFAHSIRSLKIYFMTSLSEYSVLEWLLEKGLILEATLRSPYVDSIDLAVISRELKS